MCVVNIAAVTILRTNGGTQVAANTTQYFYQDPVTGQKTPITEEQYTACMAAGACQITEDTITKPVYRGGNSVQARPQDVRIDKATGLLKPTRGISLNTDEEAMINRLGGARQVLKVPKDLQIIYTSPNHFEIAPRVPMTMQQYQELLNQTTYK
jgi:hypothetical protein